MMVAAIVGQFMHEATPTNIALVGVGAAMVVIAPLLPKLESFEFGPTRAAAKFRAAEDDIEKGNVVEADKAVKAVEAALGGSGALSVEVTASADAVVIPANVVITQEAMATLTRLNSDDRAAVESALRTLGTAQDPGKIEPGSGGRSYFVRRVNPSLRLFYRLYDKTSPGEPDTFVVVNIAVRR
jgi:hypothetical protein